MNTDILQNSSFWTALAALQLLVLFQAYLAYADGRLTGGQMLDENDEKQGLPYLGHGGMYGDVIAISLVAAYLYGTYGLRWIYPSMGVYQSVGNGKGLIIATGISLVVTIVAHVAWALGSKNPGGNGVHAANGNLTPAGFVHALYMIITFTAFIMYYFFTDVHSIKLPELWAISIIVVIHLIIGVAHPFPKLFKPSWWAGKPMDGVFETLIPALVLVFAHWNIMRQIQH